MKKGLLIIISGPSGVGKGTVRKYFMDDDSLRLTYSISMTTRKPRQGERDGVDYIFTTREKFEEAIAEGELLEWAEFVGNYYGTPLTQVEKLREEGKNVLLEIEVQGADQVRKKCPDALSIFIIPPSMEELEKRIRGRRSEPEEIVQQRLAKAENEMKMVSNYKYIVCNEDPQLAAELISSIIKRHMYVGLMISWAGLRGAASIVFAIMVIAASSSSSDTLFHTVFMVALLSVAIQGTLLPFVAEKLKMVDDNCDVRMTFNDYKEASEITMMQMEIPEGHNWENRLVKDVSMPTGSLAVMIKRHGETLIPGGDTRILAGDTIVLSVPAYESGGQEHLEEQEITPKHRWCNKTIAELMLPHGTLIVLVRRDNENIIPNGQTEILEGDHVVIYR